MFKINALMRLWLIFLFFGLTNEAFSQTEEIYKKTFSDPSNFDITHKLDNKKPSSVLIIDTTQSWSSERFWIMGLYAEKALKAIIEDEHHSYHHTYLFKDSVLDKLFEENEKIALRKRSEQLTSKKINLKGPNYASIPSVKKVKGFNVVTSEPVFSSDGNYAFIDLLILFKKTKKAVLRDSYFGTVCIVYQKQSDQNWKKIHKKEHLIL